MSIKKPLVISNGIITQLADLDAISGLNIHPSTLTQDVTIPTGYNAIWVETVTTANGVTLTVESGAFLVTL